MGRIKIALNDEIPALEFYKSTLAEFENSIAQLDSYDDILKLFISIIGSFPPALISRIDSQQIEVYRTRVVDELKEDISQPDTFSYCRDISKVEKGRANLKGFPVFYGSSCEDTSIRECSNKISVGQNVYISKWRIKKKSKCNALMLIFDESIKHLGIDHMNYNERIINNFKNNLLIYSHDKQDAITYFMTTVGNYFIRNSHKLSSFLAHYSLYNSYTNNPYPIDFIVYPSLKANHANFNLAIKPEFVDNEMELVEVTNVTIKEFTGDGTYSALIKIGKSILGKLQWYYLKLLPDLMKIKKLLFCYNNQWHSLAENNEELSFRFHHRIFTFKELRDILIPIYFNRMVPECMKKINRENAYELKKLNFEFTLRDGSLEISYRNIEYRISAIWIILEYKLIDVEINENEIQSTS